jgi:hypothetical protein
MTTAEEDGVSLRGLIVCKRHTSTPLRGSGVDSAARLGAVGHVWLAEVVVVVEIERTRFETT